MLLHGRVGAVAADPGHIKTHGRECAANVVVDFARNRGALLLDGGLQVFRQLREPALGAGQLGHGVFAHAPGLVHLQCARDHVGQALDVVLEQVVGHAQAHGVYRRRLADGA